MCLKFLKILAWTGVWQRAVCLESFANLRPGDTSKAGNHSSHLRRLERVSVFLLHTFAGDLVYVSWLHKVPRILDLEDEKDWITLFFNVVNCVWLFVTPWSVAHQAPLYMGFSRQEYWSGLPFPSPGDLPNPGIEPSLLCLQHWQMDSLPRAPPGKPYFVTLLPFIDAWFIWWAVNKAKLSLHWNLEDWLLSDSIQLCFWTPWFHQISRIFLLLQNIQKQHLTLASSIWSTHVLRPKDTLF